MITNQEYNDIMKRIEQIFDATPADTEFTELCDLVTVAEEYEVKHYHIGENQ